MKTLTCKELGGPCDAAISGNSFEEMGSNCKAHVMQQMMSGDAAHKQAVQDMMSKSAEEQQAQYADFEKKYNAAPDVN